jgi:cohesin loading factor subunit SCC2
MHSSSSSLAMALSEHVPKKKPPPKVHKAEDSTRFFNNFLSQQSAELKNNKAAPTEKIHTKRSKEHSQGSPDPLALAPATPQSSHKRKAGQTLESPSVKRSAALQNGNGISTPHKSEAQTLPSVNGTPTPRVKLEPYIAMPPVPKVYQTPSQKSKGKMRAGSEEDLGGFGDVDESPMKWRPNGVTDSVKSSARRATGDRDDRGSYMLANELLVLTKSYFQFL